MPYLQLWLTSCSCLALFVRMRLEARSHAQVICHDFVGFLAGNFQLVALLDETQFGSRVGSAMQILPAILCSGSFFTGFVLLSLFSLDSGATLDDAAILGCGSLAAGFFIALASNASSISSAWLAT